MFDQFHLSTERMAMVLLMSALTVKAVAMRILSFKNIY